MLAMDLNLDAFRQVVRVIVNDHRRNAARSKLAPTGGRHSVIAQFFVPAFLMLINFRSSLYPYSTLHVVFI